MDTWDSNHLACEILGVNLYRQLQANHMYDYCRSVLTSKKRVLIKFKYHWQFYSDIRIILQNSAPYLREISLFWSFSMFLTIDFNSGSRSNKRVPNVFILNILATRFAHTLSIFKLNLQNTEEKLFTKFDKKYILSCKKNFPKQMI